MKLQDMYTTSALMHLLNRRYGLNPFGVKTILRISTKRYNKLVKGKEDINIGEAVRLASIFTELRGRF